MAELKKVNIEQHDIDRIKNFRAKYSETVAQIGDIEIERISVEMMLEHIITKKDELEASFKQLKTDEVRLTKDFQEKYGNGEFDIEAGTFTPTQ
jgi:septal ring factor EnvC (AmiA/AmiB activator)